MNGQKYCFNVKEIIRIKGKSPGFFSKRHLYRKDAMREWNTRDLWFEFRRKGIFRVSTPSGVKDSKIVLEFKYKPDYRRSGEFNILVFDIDEKVKKYFEEAFKKVFGEKYMEKELENGDKNEF
jgi:hypothetical protein